MQSRLAIHRFKSHHVKIAQQHRKNATLLQSKLVKRTRSRRSFSSISRFNQVFQKSKYQQRCEFHTSLSSMAPSAVAPAQMEDDEHELDDDISSFSSSTLETFINQELQSFNIDTSSQQGENEEEKPNLIDLLQTFDPQLPPPRDASPEEIQVWLECSSQQETVLKYEAILESARNREDYTAISKVQRQLLEWYKPMRQRILEEQEAYFASKKKNKGANAYGPFLCTLQPEKLAIITIHEAAMYALKTGGDGCTLMKMALKIGNAIEAEVNVQRLLRMRMEKSPMLKKKEIQEENIVETYEKQEVEKEDEFAQMKKDKSLDWMYGPSHLQRFVDEMNRIDPSRKGKVRIARANQRAMKLLESAEPWATSDKVILGAVLIQMMLETATVSFPGQKGSQPAFTYEKSWVEHKKLVGHICMNEDLYQMIVEDKFTLLDAYTTRHKPMIIPPKEWVSPNEGGYTLLQTEFMRAHGCQVQKVSMQLIICLVFCNHLN